MNQIIIKKKDKRRENEVEQTEAVAEISNDSVYV